VAEFFSPTFGYANDVIRGDLLTTLSTRWNSETPVVSNCQNRRCRPSGLQRKQFRRFSSSSFTQSDVPLMSVFEPSVVIAVIFRLSRS
jgi:hypothetical protein